MLWLSSLPNSAVTQKHVSDLTKIDKMSMSDLVITLIQKKMLKRLSHSTDKRAYISFDRKGRRSVLKAIPVVEGIDVKFFSKDTSSLVQLVRNLRHLI